MTRRVPNTDPSITPAVFRVFPDGEVIALFPYTAGNTDGVTCMSYMHNGQHGVADPGITRRTRAATREEAWPLICELTSAPFSYPPFRILSRFPSNAAAARRSQVQR